MNHVADVEMDETNEADQKNNQVEKWFKNNKMLDEVELIEGELDDRSNSFDGQALSGRFSRRKDREPVLNGELSPASQQMQPYAPFFVSLIAHLDVWDPRDDVTDVGVFLLSCVVGLGIFPFSFSLDYSYLLCL